ncbi:MAG TPA: prephenate dehydrogenase [Abditibacterium sp.]|jgi:prephenate dehydrogenase
MFNRVCIVGIGLIGGSFGLALKKRGLAREVVGVARRQSTLDEAINAGVCDVATSNLVEAATNADLVFLSPPVGQMKAICEQIAPTVAQNALVTDAGSTKAQIVADCEPIFGEKASFIGGHPMTGSEKVGPGAARADLFEKATWILTPTPRTDPESLRILENLVESIGARPVNLDSQSHDELLAVTSHLPHVTAAALTHIFSAARLKNPIAPALVAGGFRDGTRVAAGSPEMWRDICLANRAAIGTSLSEMQRELADLQQILQREDEDALLDWFATAACERRVLKP